MSTEQAGTPDAGDDDSKSRLERPRFRGCVVCYSAEMTSYGLRKLGRRLDRD